MQIYTTSGNKFKLHSLTKTMKKTFVFLACLMLFVSCKENDKGPDISNVKLNLGLKRFDRDFFAIDTNNTLKAVQALSSDYPSLTEIFVYNILGLDSALIAPGVNRFIQLTKPVYDTVNVVFRDIEPLRKDLEKAFRYVKFYFPSYPVPQINTVLGPLDAMAQTSTGYTPDFLGPGFLALSLQFYLGKNFSAYADPYFIDNIAPAYRSRRFSKEYIVPDAMMLIADDLFPNQSKSKPLIEQMIERGKQWWLVDKFLPGIHDSLITGFTGNQLDWCLENEGMIWSYLVKNENLNSLEPATLQSYLGESPFTQGFSQEYSPGNLGQWIGWRIVEKYASKNPGLSVSDIMKTDPRKLLEDAKYKPK
jgi:hypothetical protein